MSAALRLEAPPDIDFERQGTAAFVLSLRARGIFDRNVLRAMETVGRDFFAPRRFADLARADVALPLACGQTMTAPAVVAAMLAALDLRPGDRVLEVGTGSGYVTALLARIGCEVVSIERREILAESACSRIAGVGLGHSIRLVCGDGLDDDVGDGRYDRILLNGAVRDVGPALTSRLVVGGRLVAASATAAAPRLLTVCRGEDGQLSRNFGAPIRISALVETAVR